MGCQDERLKEELGFLSHGCCNLKDFGELRSFTKNECKLACNIHVALAADLFDLGWICERPSFFMSVRSQKVSNKSADITWAKVACTTVPKVRTLGGVGVKGSEVRSSESMTRRAIRKTGTADLDCASAEEHIWKVGCKMNSFRGACKHVPVIHLIGGITNIRRYKYMYI